MAGQVDVQHLDLQSLARDQAALGQTLQVLLDLTLNVGAISLARERARIARVRVVFRLDKGNGDIRREGRNGDGEQAAANETEQCVQRAPSSDGPGRCPIFARAALLSNANGISAKGSPERKTP